MLKQPKGLIAAALANTGERFGFYTMMAILTLFLMSKFGIDGEQAGKIYSFFYTSIYILALVGGLIADRLRNYKGTIIAGILVMTAGYAALMVPTVTSKTVVIGALMVIAFGNGLFKGNLQALVGQLYDNEQYAKLRDTGFQIFYMFINIGAMFAPFAAVGVRNWWLRTQGFLYNSDLSALCHQYIGGTMSPEVAQGRFSELAAEVSLGGVRRTWAFSRRAISTPSTPDSTMRSAWLSWRWSSRWWFSWPTRRSCPIPRLRPLPGRRLRRPKSSRMRVRSNSVSMRCSPCSPS